MPPSPVVDVAIPVYGNLEATRRCLDAAIDARAGNSTPHAVIVIDDASPEPELRQHLDEVAAAGLVELHRNDQNLGFVRSANIAFGLHPHRDVVLLNSDTEVSGSWLDRLRACAYREPRTGTVTPLSNNAEICSYPVPCRDNPLPHGVSLTDLDALAATVGAGRDVVIPTAVGFCMYIRRDCLNEVGGFDEEEFGRGYGEENDFCVRAANAGWEHRLALDTFVFHEGGQSFADEKQSAMARAIQVVNRRHPGYDARIAEHVRKDPAAAHRRVLTAAMIRRDTRPKLLFVDHGLGGGIERHQRDLADRLKEHLFVVRLVSNRGRTAHLRLIGDTDFDLAFNPAEHLDALVDVLVALGVGRAHLHHVYGHESYLRPLLERWEQPFDITLHDYYFLSPSPHLVDVHGRHHGEPVGEIPMYVKNSMGPSPESLAGWQEQMSWYLRHAERIFAPSHDTAARHQRIHPDISTLVTPHPEPGPAPPPRARPVEDGTLRIVVVGALSRQKGADLLEATAVEARRRQAPLELHLVGYAYRQLSEGPPWLTVHGPYEDDDLPAILDAINPHLAWFPANGPETYSYTLSRCLAAGLPIAAPDLGAFPERLHDRAWTWLLPPSMDAPASVDALMAMRADLIGGQSPPVPNRPSSASAWSYERDYLSGIPASSASVDEERLRELTHRHAQLAARVRHGGWWRRALLGRAHRALRNPVTARASRLVPTALRNAARDALSR